MSFFDIVTGWQVLMWEVYLTWTGWDDLQLLFLLSVNTLYQRHRMSVTAAEGSVCIMTSESTVCQMHVFDYLYGQNNLYLTVY